MQFINCRALFADLLHSKAILIDFPYYCRHCTTTACERAYLFTQENDQSIVVAHTECPCHKKILLSQWLKPENLSETYYTLIPPEATTEININVINLYLKSPLWSYMGKRILTINLSRKPSMRVGGICCLLIPLLSQKGTVCPDRAVVGIAICQSKLQPSSAYFKK